EIVVNVGGADARITLPARGLHYAADAAAALTVAARVLGDEFDAGRAAAGFATMAPAYGRGEVIPLRGNPAGGQVEPVRFQNAPRRQLNLDARDGTPEPALTAIADGAPDVSWLYGVDFAPLPRVDVVTGEKAHQLALALAYAGV